MATEKGMMRNIFVRLCQISEIQNSKVQYAYGFVWKHVCACVWHFEKGKFTNEMVPTPAHTHTMAEVIERMRSTV